MIIYVDADGCAVKKEIYKVAARHELEVLAVANQRMGVPDSPRVRMKVVSDAFDAADDWIVENIGPGDLLITADLLLADRAIKARARVLGPKGRELNEDNIGDALASREINAHLREQGVMGSGPKPMGKADRSRFLGEMENIIQALKRSS